MKNRIRYCAKLLAKFRYDAFVISNSLNIAYLTGQPEIPGFLLVTPEEEAIFLTSFLYLQVAKKTLPFKVRTPVKNSSIFELLVQIAQTQRYKRVGFEPNSLSQQEYEILNQMFGSGGIELLKTENFIEKMRMIKERLEISRIKKSLQITKQALNFAEKIVDGQMSEKSLSIEIGRFLCLKGDNALAFNPIVAAAANTVFPHHCPGEEKIGRNFFLIDLGSKYYGYCADLTRMFFWSKMPLLLRRLYSTVKRARDAAVKKISDGVKADEVDRAAREIIEKKGWGKYFGHGLGHGIGLAVHEPPRIAPGNKEILREGMVVTIEPAIYFKNKFGVRIEDMVLVKKDRGEILSGNIHW